MSRAIPPGYKTRNWPAGNEALRQRGSLTIWFDADMVWVPPQTGSLGRVLRYREGRIVHGLRLVGRQDLNTKIRAYRVTADPAGFTSFAESFASHAEKVGDPDNMEGWGDNSAPPQNPATSGARPSDTTETDRWA